MSIMGNWDKERIWLNDAHEVAQTSAERAHQKYNIVLGQQVHMWNSLEQEFVSAVDAINSHGKTLLRFSQTPRSIGCTITTSRPGKNPTATLKFDSQAHCVTLSIANLASGNRPNLRYAIQANDDNRAEFSSEEGIPITRSEIVSFVLSHLR
jgi:hypothetical protein